MYLLFLIPMMAFAFEVNRPAPVAPAPLTPHFGAAPVAQEGQEEVVEPMPLPVDVKAPPRLKPAPRMKPGPKVEEPIKTEEIKEPTITREQAPATAKLKQIDPQFMLKVVVTMKDGEKCKLPTVDVETQKWFCLDEVINGKAK